MTRETKIGLIVAGSFLCLVCIVVASKWKRGDTPSEGEEQSVQVAAAKPTQDNKPTPEVKKKELEPVKQKDTSPHVTFPAIPEKGQTGSNDKKLENSVPMPPPLFVPPPLTEADRLKVEQDRKKLEALTNLQPAPMPIVSPPGTFMSPPIDIGKPSVPEPSPMPLFPITQDGDKKKGPADQVGVIPLPPKPLVQVEEKKPLEPAKTPVFGGVEIPPPVVIPPNGINSGPPPIVETKQPVNPGVKPEGIPTFPPLPMNTQPAVIPFNEKEQPPTFPSANPPKDSVPTFPSSNPPKDGVPTFPAITPTPMNNGVNTPTIPKNPTPTFPPSIDTTPMPIPRIGGNELPSAPPITIGSGIGGNTKPLPTVRDVNNTYVCQAGDTSFAILSLRLYRTEKYADALHAYNRDHAQFIKNGNALLTNPPSLAPGQQVEYPSLDLLERNYRSLIREGSTIPTIPAANAVNLAKPSPLAPGIAAISNPPAGATRSYRVQNAAGESILDIAERQLGNRGQWTEIYRINQANPVVRPPALIPAGTDLKLP